MSGVDIGLGGIGGVVDGEGVIAYILASVLDGDGVDGVLELERCRLTNDSGTLGWWK